MLSLTEPSQLLPLATCDHWSASLLGRCESLAQQTLLLSKCPACMGPALAWRHLAFVAVVEGNAGLTLSTCQRTGQFLGILC